MIEVLHETGKRLEELTAGEVDSVADRDGRTFVLLSAQEQLRNSEAARQAAILNALPAHIALLDAQGLIISVNEAWRRFGNANVLQGPGHGIGVNYLEVCDRAPGNGASEAHQAAEGIRSVLGGAAKRFSIEYPCHSPLQRRWFQMIVTPLSDRHPNAAVVMHIDVTAERQAKERLHASELRFRQMAENIRDVFFLIDADTNRMLYISPAYEEIWGRSRESAYANPESWTEAIHPDDRASAYQAYKEGMAAGTFEHEYRIVRPDGSIRWMEVRGFPVRDDAGRIARVAGIVADITERKQAARELRESERRFSAMLDNVDLVSVMLDREARITYCNDCFLRLTGWQLEEVIGRNWFELFIPPEFDDVKEIFAALLANLPEAWHHENEILTRSGERRLIRWNNSVLRSGAGDVIGTASIGEDITEQKKSQESLMQNEERTRLIVESALDALVVMDVTGRIADWNTQAEKTFGWSREQVIGVPLTETIIPARHREAHKHGLGVFLETGEGPIVNRRVEISAMHRDGHEFPVELSISPIRLGGAWIFSSFIRDLTDRKEAENRIRRLNRVYAMLGGINALIARVRDRDELFREACRIAVEVGAFKMAWIGVIDPQTLNGKVVAWHGGEEGYVDKVRLTARDDMPESERPASRAMRQSQPVICNDIATDLSLGPFREVLLAEGHKSLGCFPLTVNGRPEAVVSLFAGEPDVFDDEEMRLLQELARDLSFALDHLEKAERLNYLAFYDSLTGFANRALFHERLEQSVVSANEQGRKMSLVIMDIERFKTVNDTLGWQAGDALLKEVAARVQRAVVDVGRLARIDADHFAVMISDLQTAEEVAHRVEQRAAEIFGPPFQIGESELRVSAKFGIAMSPDDGADADTLFRNADAALKNAKARGERYLFYARTMNERVSEKLALENQLRQALEKGEFVLHYQPKVNLASGKLTGAEALIRWNDPRTGLVPPGLFIPILEETGLIHEVGRWALRKAIEDYLRWRNAGLAAVPVAVNVSPLQLRNRGFIAEIQQAIGIDAHAAAGLELEITESLIMEDVRHSIASLQAIRAMGVAIAIDDFGTGFSSLSYLAKLPVDSLKIDRSFVEDMTAAPEGQALVSTIISLAHSLKLKVVAEGVETKEQSRLLRLLKCDEMQGFLFGKPVPSEIFETKYLTPRPAG